MLDMGQDKGIFFAKIVKTFLSDILNACFGCSEEPSRWDGSSDYPTYVLVEK